MFHRYLTNMSGNIIIKANCSSLHDVNNVQDKIVSEAWGNFWNYMETLQSASYVSLIAYHSGTNALSGAKGSWDRLPSFGPGAFGVWKFNTSSIRNFEWYMYAQCISGSGNVSIQSQNSPCLSYGQTNFRNNSNERGIIYSIAICHSGSSSFNPWNGTLGQGNAVKGNPVWVSGSNDRQLIVFPRSNSVSGSHNSVKQNTQSCIEIHANITSHKYTFMADRDSIMFFSDQNSIGTNHITYIGPFLLRDELHNKGICDSSYGFCVLDSFNNFVINDTTITPNSNYGDINGTTLINNGGVSLGISNFEVANARIVTTSNFDRTFTSTNTFANGFIEEYEPGICVYENPNVGFAGVIKSPIFRLTYKGSPGNMLADGSKVFWTQDANSNSPKVITPWGPDDNGRTISPTFGYYRSGSLIVINKP